MQRGKIFLIKQKQYIKFISVLVKVIVTSEQRFLSGMAFSIKKVVCVTVSGVVGFLTPH